MNLEIAKKILGDFFNSCMEAPIYKLHEWASQACLGDYEQCQAIDILKVYKIGKEAFDKGQNVEAAILDFIEQIRRESKI